MASWAAPGNHVDRLALIRLGVVPSRRHIIVTDLRAKFQFKSLDGFDTSVPLFFPVAPVHRRDTNFSL